MVAQAAMMDFTISVLAMVWMIEVSCLQSPGDTGSHRLFSDHSDPGPRVKERARKDV